MGHDLSGMPDQCRKQLVFDGRQVDLVVANEDPARCKVHAQTCVVKYRFVLAGPQPKSMAQGNADPGHQFSGAEGLRQIVVRTGIKGLDLVLLLFPRRYDDDRRLGPLPEPLGHFESVEVGQAEVEQDHVGIAHRRLHQPFLRRAGLNEPVPMALQRYPEEPAHLRLVFDQKDKFFFITHRRNSKRQITDIKEALILKYEFPNIWIMVPLKGEIIGDFVLVF